MKVLVLKNVEFLLFYFVNGLLDWEIRVFEVLDVVGLGDWFYYKLMEFFGG